MALKFKEYITKENLEEFTNYKVSKIKLAKDHVYVQFFIEGMENGPEFEVNDYSFIGINSYSSYSWSEKWKSFMLRKIKPQYRGLYVDEYDTYADSLTISWANADID